MTTSIEEKELQALRDLLMDRKDEISNIAKDCGVSRTWLREFAVKATNSDPGFSRISRVAKHLGITICVGAN